MQPAGATNRQIRILIVDDHPVLRAGLAAVIRRDPGMTIAAEASNGREAIECFRVHRPDVTLMDLQMPLMNGVASTHAIRTESPGARIVVLTTFPGDAQALRALKAGASGYLLKSMVVTSLLEAIRSVHAGLRYIPREIAVELAAHVTDESLSARELEVLQQIAGGSSNKTIASQLFVSEDTVKSHVKNILHKLSANDRTHAVTIALKRGIIDV